MSTDQAPIAILSALPQEQEGLAHAVAGLQTVRRAGRDYGVGVLDGQPVVLALSRIGKVAAATTTATLLEHFGARAVVFTGVAGGVGADVAVGDVVVASGFVQHDMDASPLFPRFEIPLTGTSVQAVDPDWSQRLLEQSRLALAGHTFAGRASRVHQGLIATGDRFVCSADEARALVQRLEAAGHGALAVEMEGAAVAQVCNDYGVPMAAVRTISDRADDTAHVDFPQFVDAVARVYANAIIRGLLQSL
ncbi:5'-methylthioadenosine/adenosylhomocysteine nucleosidase [Curvibacter sp. APW13]|uniref:5'-methylthioadenosine/adenosylhomocysteine nucleosidase n=1 Tax=Curvibacter sp. APW13 TaxID=3077236 RepID=UPI0028E07678|nr:5'-methylthioadenosine/adenosylhomocysteine nucleosidase [Curvibacter sp. APW13]MDT8990038.1 5'-methylthioadenosine/adenosylhomocysteine nucleosidase [Curvibacter sp. APW13]